MLWGQGANKLFMWDFSRFSYIFVTDAYFFVATNY